MRIATPGPARSHLLLLATLMLVLGGGSVWLALGTAQPLQAPPLPPAPATALPSATPAPQPPPSPTPTAAPLPAPTATATPVARAGRADRSRNLVATRHNNGHGAMFRYLYRPDPMRTDILLNKHAFGG